MIAPRHCRSNARALGLAALLLAATLAGPARADAAADHAKQAGVAYSLQDWKTAIAEYQAAYRADQKPEYLWGVAQAQRLSGDFSSAIQSFKAFMRTGPNPQQTATAEALISKCEAEITKRELEAKAAAAATQAKPAEPAPPPNAGPAAAEPTAPAIRAADEPPRLRLTLPVYVAGGVAGAGAIVGTVFGVIALGDRSKFDQAPTRANADKTRTMSLVSDIGFGVALVSAVTGVVLLLTHVGVQKSPATTARRLEPFVAPSVGPHGGGLVGAVRF
jgi:tetratricopeptide (TPR) repeat protein